jgi:homoprotocatechuate degradation regulator HpaR
VRDFQEVLPFKLLRARDATMAHFRPLFHAHAVTEQQWRIIRTLEEYGELEARRLADLCALLSPSLTGILRRLQQSGLIERRRVVEDRRRVNLRLSPKGQALFEKIRPLVEAKYQEFEMEVSPDKLERLNRLLDEVIALGLDGAAE